MKHLNLTPNEIEILSKVASMQIEDNFSEYTQVTAPYEMVILNSLVKKGLIYNCNDDFMYCLTDEGFEICKENNISTTHIHLHDC
jgi:predicted transcriptional regulator